MGREDRAGAGIAAAARASAKGAIDDAGIAVASISEPIACALRNAVRATPVGTASETSFCSNMFPSRCDGRAVREIRHFPGVPELEEDNLASYPKARTRPVPT